jgi:hypothetical protein
MRAQQAVSNSSAIEQSRLFQQTPTALSTSVNADGTAVGDVANTSGDDSMGAQQILKEQPRVLTFSVGGDASAFYTSNAALTRRDTTDDMFFVVNGGASWTPPLGNHLEAQLAARGSLFRYNDNPTLDFESLGAGAGITWTPPQLAGVAVFARYDFTELLDRDGREILNDHEFTMGAQKVFALGRSHAIVAGITGAAGISDPSSAQRDQVAAFIGYHLRITRSFDTDLLYRFAYYFYNDSSRADRNQVFTWNFRYHITDWADATAFFSYGNNNSNRSVFDYDVISTGGGLGFNVRF